MSKKNKDGITIYNAEDFKGMRKAGKLAAECLDYITDFVDIGVTTEYLDDLCRKFILEHGAIPACLGYRGYPKSTCISINHEICHGIPSSERKLLNGDMLNIDVTVIAQKPKLMPHIEKMRENIAMACGCDINDINVKATTTEKLGFVGRGDGCEVYAVVLLRR